MAYGDTRAEYYREKARQVREIAKGVLGPGLKEEYERLAKQYDDLAAKSESGNVSL